MNKLTISVLAFLVPALALGALTEEYREIYPSEPPRILLVGDSETEGVIGPTDPSASWASLMQSRTESSDFFTVVNLGCGGSMVIDWITFDPTLTARPEDCHYGNVFWSRYLPATPARYVHVWLGHNDAIATVGTPPGMRTTEEFDSELRALIALIQADNPDVKILLSFPILPTYPGAAGDFRRERTASFWPVIDAIIADTAGVVEGCRFHEFWDYDAWTKSNDWIHPNDAGQEAVYQCLRPKFMALWLLDS